MGGVAVLHVVAERAVMHDVIERNRAVIPRLQSALTLVGRDGVVDGSD
jgi:hypothetical protein